MCSGICCIGIRAEIRGYKLAELMYREFQNDTESLSFFKSKTIFCNSIEGIKQSSPSAGNLLQDVPSVLRHRRIRSRNKICGGKNRLGVISPGPDGKTNAFYSLDRPLSPCRLHHDFSHPPEGLPHYKVPCIQPGGLHPVLHQHLLLAHATTISRSWSSPQYQDYLICQLNS